MRRGGSLPPYYDDMKTHLIIEVFGDLVIPPLQQNHPI